MNSAEEVRLAWTLMDSATGLLSKEARAQLCIQVGAGDQDGAIVAVLELYVRVGATMPTEVKDTVESWIDGYRGADTEVFLRGLIERITLVDSGSGSAQRAAAGSPSTRLGGTRTVQNH